MGAPRFTMDERRASVLMFERPSRAPGPRAANCAGGEVGSPPAQADERRGNAVRPVATAPR